MRAALVAALIALSAGCTDGGGSGPSDGPSPDEEALAPGGNATLEPHPTADPLDVVEMGPGTIIALDLTDDIVYRVRVEADDGFARAGASWGGEYGLAFVPAGRSLPTGDCDGLTDMPFHDTAIQSVDQGSWDAGTYDLWVWGTEEATLRFNEAQSGDPATDTPRLVPNGWRAIRAAVDEPAETSPPSASHELALNASGAGVVVAQMIPPFAVGVEPWTETRISQGPDDCSWSRTETPAGLASSMESFALVTGAFNATGSFGMDPGLIHPQTPNAIFQVVALVAPGPSE